MQAPVDYPIDDAARDAEFTVDELTYAVYLDRLNAAPAVAASAFAARQQQIVIDLPFQPPEKEKTTPKPLAELAHMLLAGEASRGWTDTSGVLARFTRSSR